MYYVIRFSFPCTNQRLNIYHYLSDYLHIFWVATKNDLRLNGLPRANIVPTEKKGNVLVERFKFKVKGPKAEGMCGCGQSSWSF